MKLSFKNILQAFCQITKNSSFTLFLTFVWYTICVCTCHNLLNQFHINDPLGALQFFNIKNTPMDILINTCLHIPLFI